MRFDWSMQPLPRKSRRVVDRSQSQTVRAEKLGIEKNMTKAKIENNLLISFNFDSDLMRKLEALVLCLGFFLAFLFKEIFQNVSTFFC